MEYIIMNDEGEYWFKNEWSSYSASGFSFQDTKQIKLPKGGEWVRHKDPIFDLGHFVGWAE